MAQSTKRSPGGLLSEAGKKAARGIGDAAKQAVGLKTSPRGKSPGGNLSEAAKKAGRGISDAARKAVGMRRSRVRKSGSK
jgi:hypothetical protein